MDKLVVASKLNEINFCLSVAELISLNFRVVLSVVGVLFAFLVFALLFKKCC